MSTEPVGSLAEEAAKLIAVMQSWATDRGTEQRAERDDHGASSGDDNADASANGHADHTGTAAECRWCPLRQAVRVARATTPEVREHLANAGLSLAMAFKGLMENIDESSTRTTPMERIDLDPDPNAPED
jgi:hypothetical protein